MTFPTPYTVDHYPWSSSTSDDLGNAVPVWPQTPTVTAVHGYTINIVERLGDSSAGEIFDATVSAPASWLVTIRDRVALPDGLLYEVVGVRLQDGGFHSWKPGSVVLLKRLEG